MVLTQVVESEIVLPESQHIQGSFTQPNCYLNFYYIPFFDFVEMFLLALNIYDILYICDFSNLGKEWSTLLVLKRENANLALVC